MKTKTIVDPILKDIDALIERGLITQTGFGRVALNDPALVQKLRDGRELLPSTKVKIQALINEHIKHYGE